MVILTFVTFLIIGIIIGFVASKMVNLRGDDPRLGMAAASVAALIAGILYSFISGVGLAALNLHAIVIAAIAAVVAAVIWHLLRSRFVSHDSYTTRRSY